MLKAAQGRALSFDGANDYVQLPDLELRERLSTPFGLGVRDVAFSRQAVVRSWEFIIRQKRMPYCCRRISCRRFVQRNGIRWLRNSKWCH